MAERNRQITAWVDAYTKDLLQWTQMRVGELSIAEDLVQDTFVSAYHGFDKFENRSAPKSWLISILNRKIADHFRNGAKMKFVPSNFGDEKQANYISDTLFQDNESWVSIDSGKSWDSDEHLLDNPEFNAVMAACMDDLPTKWRYIVTSKYIDDKNSSEICQEMEMTKSNYWQVVHRAKLLLKVCIEKYWK